MNGTGVSPGIAIGNALILKKTVTTLYEKALQNDDEKKSEIEKFEKAVRNSVEEIENLKNDKNLSLQPEEISILETQIEFLCDPQIKTDVEDKINNEFKTAISSVSVVIDEAVLLFRNIDDEYLSARAADVRDIGNRLIKNLSLKPELSSSDLGENTIIISEELTPSDTISLDTNKITGFATQSGGKTSHTAIIARAKGIPAVVACGSDLMDIRNNDIVIIDGSTGEVIVRPDQEIIKKFESKKKIFSEKTELLKSLRDLPAKTTDGQRITLYGNISGAEDLDQVFENGGEGVGLLRTELLFMGRNSFPSEEEQFQFYKQVAVKSQNRPAIIRTLDIGGDKQLEYFGIPHEDNPFMGYRAIRICLDQRDIFLTQLRAILRASAFGKLKIMFPMICNINEIRQAKECVQLVKNDLHRAGIAFSDGTELGMMIEIPSAALTADLLAKEVDFFSIGTNDLCQYTLAVDRMNDKVSELYNHFHPAVLRLIQNVIEQGHKQNRHVGLCGEMASDPLAALLLLGMGLDEFSMGAASIPVIKNIIVRNSLEKAQEIKNKVMEMDNSDNIIAYLKEVSK